MNQMNQMMMNRTWLMIHRVQILWAGAATQRSFCKANMPIISRASIPHTITYTGTAGAAGHSYTYTAPDYTEQRHLDK